MVKKRIIKIILAFLLSYFSTSIIDVCVFKSDISLKEHLMNLGTLTMPGTTTWHLKAQVLFYVITLASLVITNYEMSVAGVIIGSAIYSFLMYYMGFETFWWHTALCYAIGYAVAAYRKEIKGKLDKVSQRKILIVGMLIGSMFYVAGEFIFAESYILNLLCISFMICGLMMFVYASALSRNSKYMIV